MRIDVVRPLILLAILALGVAMASVIARDIADAVGRLKAGASHACCTP